MDKARPREEEVKENIVKIRLALVEENSASDGKRNANSRTRRVTKPRVIEDLGFSSGSFLSRKTQRTSCDSVLKQKTKKESSSKVKKCLRIFQQFKASILYHDYPLFAKVEKNLKSNGYLHHTKLALDIRSIFTQYFVLYSFEPENYIKSLAACNSFEAIYKDYDNKVFIQESRNLIDIKTRLNKLQRELKEANASNRVICAHRNRNDSFDNAGEYSAEAKTANRKYKLILANNIRHLSLEQKKGIMSLLMLKGAESGSSMLEIDVNRLSSCQLKELDRYVQKCLFTNAAKPSDLNENGLQKLDSTVTQSQDLHDESLEVKQSFFSENESLSSDESDSDNESNL